MKSLRRFFFAALLTSILATAALADDGIIHGDKTPPPPPPPATSQSQSPVAEGTTDGSANVSNASDSIVEVALNVFGAMLAI